MLFLIFIVPLLLATIQAQQYCPMSKFPNNTATALHWWQEGGKNFKVHDVYSTWNDGHPDYPVGSDDYLVLNVTNSGAATSNIRQDITLWCLAVDCTWMSWPDLAGNSNNLNPCTNDVTGCPFPPGNQKIVVPLSFINAAWTWCPCPTPPTVDVQIADYQFAFTFTNKNNGDFFTVYVQVYYLFA